MHTTEIATRVRALVGALAICAFTAMPGSAQEPQASLTMDEVIDLFHRPVMQRNPQLAIRDFIRFNKIAFLPTRSVRRYLRDNGVPAVAIDSLKHYFAPRIRYRVCEFSPTSGDGAQFAKVVSRVLETRRIMLKSTASLLADKTFEPVLCGPTGLTAAEMREIPNFHTGFVLILGDLERGQPSASQATVTARLVFASRVQGRQSFTTPLMLVVADNREGWASAAEQIAVWSIRAVEQEVEGDIASLAPPR